MPQDTILLENTVYENLLSADRNAGQDGIWDILERISMKEEIQNLPKGIDTETGEKGERLSGGQRQRILLAMALLKKAKIIILDEPTSALDSANTYVLMNLLDQLKKDHTVIVTSHDSIVKEYADVIYDFERGVPIPS